MANFLTLRFSYTLQNIFHNNIRLEKFIIIDGFTLEGALWVIRARFQGNKAAKCSFLFIFPF